MHRIWRRSGLVVLYQSRINVWANIKLYESVLKSIEGPTFDLSKRVKGFGTISMSVGK